MKHRNVININNNNYVNAASGNMNMQIARHENMLRQASGVAKLIDMYLDGGVNTMDEKEVVQQACGAISSLIDTALTN